jgi:uncharacterized protein YkwD
MKRPNYKDKAKKQEVDYEELASNIIKEINTVRENPESYIEILEKDKSYFKENILYRPDEDPLKTHEGEAAYDEAINFLKSLKSLHELSPSDHLSKASLDHASDIGESGAFSNEGSNKENISQRVESYAEWDFVLCLNMDFGGRTAQEVVISFITGDGDTNRTHRKNLFRNDIYFIGTGCHQHKEAEVVSVVTYAGNVRELNTVAPEIKDFLKNHLKKVEEEKQNPKPKKIKTKFQLEDPDAPDNAVNYITYKKMKLVEDRAKHCTQRVYTLSDGTQHIVEVFDDLKVRAGATKKEE